MTLVSRTFVAGMVLAGALALGGCGGGHEDTGQPAGQPTQTTMPPGGAPAAQP